MTVTLLTVQTLTGSGTAITTLLPCPPPPVSQKSRRICTNYKSGPGQSGGGEQLLHLLHTTYATVAAS